MRVSDRIAFEEKREVSVNSRTILVLFAVVIACSAVLFAQDQQLSAAEKYFTNTELVDQNGKSHRFYSDILKDKVVVISCFYSSGYSVDPVVNKGLMQIQKHFKERMGSDLIIISITVDPERDTPKVLKEYAAKLDAGPGRLFLTGEKENVDLILKKLGYYVDAPEDHNTIILIGNDRTSHWKKAFGLARSSELIEIVSSVLDDKGN